METTFGTVKICETPEQVAVEGAQKLLSLANEYKDTGLPAYVALSGGSTPKEMYHKLCDIPEEDGANLRQLHYFFGDERSVDNYHQDSNVRLAMGGFLLRQKIPYAHIHAPNGAARPLGKEAHRLTRELESILPRDRNRTPIFDLIFLGMGADGHTASLFPNTRGLDSHIPGYVANEVPQLDTFRLSLTYPVLHAAKEVYILCTGSGKKDVIRQIFQEPNRSEVYPIERLNPYNVTWILDKAAGESL